MDPSTVPKGCLSKNNHDRGRCQPRHLYLFMQTEQTAWKTGLLNALEKALKRRYDFTYITTVSKSENELSDFTFSLTKCIGIFEQLKVTH